VTIRRCNEAQKRTEKCRRIRRKLFASSYGTNLLVYTHNLVHSEGNRLIVTFDQTYRIKWKTGNCLL